MIKLKINIYQNYYDDSQKDRLDHSFIPYDNTKSKNPEYYEFSPILNLYESQKYLESDFCGLFSYKFNTKTGITGDKFKNFIINNPGYDVYFINPHPQLAYFYYNSWEQGEYWHKGLKQVAEKVLYELDIMENINKIPRHDSNNLCYSNFWVGNEKFWSIYGSIILKIKKLIFSNIELRKELFKNTFHSNSNCPMFPFIFERLFSTFLSLNSEIKYLSYPYSKDEIYKLCLFERERNYLYCLWDKKINIKNLNEEFNNISNKHFEMTKEYFENYGLPKSLL